MSLEQTQGLLDGWTVLVVDDEPESIEIAQVLLEIAGASVITATNGKDGYTTAKAKRPDFILSDLAMPIMDGWEMIKRIKGDLATESIPVIAITAHGIEGDRNRAIAAGFHNFLDKPLQPITFIRDLLNLLTDVPNFSERLIKGKTDTSNTPPPPPRN